MYTVLHTGLSVNIVGYGTVLHVAAGLHTEGGGERPGISSPQRKSPSESPPPPRILKVYVQFYMALWYWVTFLGVLTNFH